jgi:uncharacterized protein
MTNEERDIITRFIERVGGAPSASFGSVPGATPALPPIDREADALIGELFAKYPEARYRLTQTAFVQEHALAEAQNRIKRLEYEVQQAQAAAQEAAAQPRSGGFLSGLFGGGPPRPPVLAPSAWNQGGPQQQPYAQPQYAQGGPPPPPPQYAPGYQPGMFQRGGSGFLGSALTTAAGVAGGMVAGNLLTNMLTGGHHMGGSSWGESAGGVGGSPWGAPAVTDQGTWDNTSGAAASNQDYVDNGSWDQQPAQDSSWTDNSGSSWDTSSGDSGSWDSGSSDSGGSSDDSF